MRYNQSTLKASGVHGYARQLLVQTFEEEPHQPIVPLSVVASVLILAACWQTSLTGACSLVKDAPCHRHVRQALYACLPPRPRDLLSRILHALRQTLPEHLFWAPRVMALDMHQRPYYGKKGTKGTTRRQEKKSTRKSFTYATLAVLDRCGRFTVGLLATRPHMRLTTLVEQLLLQAQEVGLDISYLMMDKEFYCAEVIALLQKRGVAFLVPAKKRGGKAGGGNQHLFAPEAKVGWYNYTWTAPLRRLDFKTKKRHQRGTITVQVRMCVAGQSVGGKALVYASWGLVEVSPAQIAQNYRRRFGIETKYRQLEQCLAITSSRKEQLRLLLVGLALVLCNLWALLHEEVFSTGPVSERVLHLGQLRLARLIAALAAAIAEQFGGWLSQWPIQRPLPQRFATFQTP